MIRTKLTTHMTDAELAEYLAEVEAMRRSACGKADFKAKVSEIGRGLAHIAGRMRAMWGVTASLPVTKENNEASELIGWYLGTERDALTRAKKKWERLLEHRKEGDGSFEERMRIARAIQIETLFAPEKAVVTQTRIHCLCPFHVERSASFVVFRDKNRFHCFGCGLNGDAMDFHRKANGTSLMETLDELSPIKNPI